MSYDIEGMRAKILLLADPNSGYTQEDFNNEFNDRQKVNFKMDIKFVNTSNNPDPEYATQGASGFDLRANIGGSGMINLPVNRRVVVSTGLFFEIPDNFEIQLRPRSGLAAKNGVTVLNTPGTIDADYRGEIKVILINLGQEDFMINHGDRIAQAVIAPVTAKNVINLTKVNEITNTTERGSNGFGSTGKS